LKAEQKYDENISYVSNGQVFPGYPGNCPFLKHNREKYLKEKEDALRKEKETPKAVEN